MSKKRIAKLNAILDEIYKLDDAGVRPISIQIMLRDLVNSPRRSYFDSIINYIDEYSYFVQRYCSHHQNSENLMNALAAMAIEITAFFARYDYNRKSTLYRQLMNVEYALEEIQHGALSQYVCELANYPIRVLQTHSQRLQHEVSATMTDKEVEHFRSNYWDIQHGAERNVHTDDYGQLGNWIDKHTDKWSTYHRAIIEKKYPNHTNYVPF